MKSNILLPNNAKVIEDLLDHGAGLAMRDNAGRSVLHITSQSNTELLIKRGADINAQDKDGNTPLHLILKDLLILKYFHTSLKNKIIMLMKADADPNLKNNEGLSPIDLAIESGIKEAIALLKSEK
jgi:ankyrin repeat protein